MGAQGRSVSARRRNGSGSPQRSPREQIWITGSRSGSGKMPIERRTQGPHSCSSLVPVHPLSPHLLTHHLSAPAPCSSHMGGTAPGPGAFELRALPVGSTPSTHSPLHRGLAYHQCPEREEPRLLGQTFSASTLDVKAKHTQGCNALPLPFWWVTDHI